MINILFMCAHRNLSLYIYFEKLILIYLNIENVQFNYIKYKLINDELNIIYDDK